MKTATQAAKEIGCSPSTVTRWADFLGFTEKYAGALMLSKKQISEIAKHRRLKAGNPNFGKK